jgi:HsdM N-terminal domain
MAEATIKNHAAFIWSVADLLRGDYKQSEYGKVILPLTLLRRLDCVLEPPKAAVLERAQKLKGRIENVEPVLESGRRSARRSRYLSGCGRRSKNSVKVLGRTRREVACARAGTARQPPLGVAAPSGGLTGRAGRLAVRWA